MSNEDRRTKAQLLEELARVKQEKQELADRFPLPPRAVPEADALADCIRALDKLVDTRTPSYSMNNREAVRRTIIALCVKYDVGRVVTTIMNDDDPSGIEF